MRDVFAVEEVSLVNENTWLVRGRAYEDLKVGDIVGVIDGAQTSSIKPSLRFIITAISTYGKAVQELHRMLTGDLILQGANGDKLKEARILVNAE